MKRYFIVFYNAELNRGHSIGESLFTTESGIYLNCERSKEQIKEMNPNFGNVVITGIQELSESDYNTWIFTTKEIKKPKEHIICAANYYDDGCTYECHKPSGIPKTGFVITGRRHHNCIFIFSKIFRYPYDEKALKIMQTEIQGFLTNTNRFVDRKEAYKIAKEANQIITGDKEHPAGLFSEDLY